MTEKYISLDELKIIAEAIKVRLLSNINNENLNNFHQQAINELIALDYEFQDITIEKNEKEESKTLFHSRYDDFYAYKYDIYEPLCQVCIHELFIEIYNNTDAQSIQLYFKTLCTFLNHNHFQIIHNARNLLKKKNILATLNYFIEEINKATNLEQASYFLDKISFLDIYGKDFEIIMTDNTFITRLLTAVKKCVYFEQKNEIENALFQNLSINVMSIVSSFGKFYPEEIAKLDTEIIYLLDLDNLKPYFFNSTLQKLCNVFIDIKPYFSIISRKKIINILNEIASSNYKTDIEWVSTDILPALEIICSDDKESQLIASLLKKIENIKGNSYKHLYDNEIIFSEVINFCENHLTQLSPENDKMEYYITISELIETCLKYAEFIFQEGGDYVDICNLLEKATKYAELSSEVNFKLDQQCIDHFFEIIALMRYEVDKSEMKFADRISKLYERFSNI